MNVLESDSNRHIVQMICDVGFVVPLRHLLGSVTIQLGMIATVSAIAWSQTLPPVIFFSDLEGGPNSGGENGAGAHVTLYGKNFGSTRGASWVSIGGGTASAYPIWSDTKITIQLGFQARTGSVVLTTAAGVSNGVPFTVRTGNI